MLTRVSLKKQQISDFTAEYFCSNSTSHIPKRLRNSIVVMTYSEKYSAFEKVLQNVNNRLVPAKPPVAAEMPKKPSLGMIMLSTLVQNS